MTEYDAAMANRYLQGRALSTVDMARWMDAARPYLPDAGGRVLDLGAGTGRFTGVLAAACGATVVACEPSAAMRAVCPPGTVLVGGMAEASPFGDGVFDTVWTSYVLHHVRDPAACGRELRRVLRPGGHLLLRGGFGPVERLPLFRYFPLAPGPTLASIAAAVPLSMVDRVAVEQVFARDVDELVAKVSTRSLSTLADLPNSVFQDGMAKLSRDTPDFPVVETLDLVVFRKDRAPTSRR